ncbi:hypothetical protein ILUMI_04914 [Ignelater luminosus]|uniref:Paired domain-containing protein n=1 Tax=Ignelater luminosus TaxID=2038154 RepID=A0A8K0DCZ0_IGNLU|nr:hypothetical protein ILUMI_04914 [Ignelater luminosus]
MQRFGKLHYLVKLDDDGCSLKRHFAPFLPRNIHPHDNDEQGRGSTVEFQQEPPEVHSEPPPILRRSVRERRPSRKLQDYDNMPRGKSVGVQKRMFIVALHKEGYSVRDIAKKLKVAKSAVHDAIRRYQTDETYKDLERPGPSRVTTETEDNRIRAPEITAELNNTRSKKVLVSTVKRRLQEADLQGRVAVRKLLFRRENRQKDLSGQEDMRIGRKKTGKMFCERMNRSSRRFRSKCPTPQQALWNILQQEWEALQPEVLQKLVKRMQITPFRKRGFFRREENLIYYGK